jgi:hypothetical protein
MKHGHFSIRLGTVQEFRTTLRDCHPQFLVSLYGKVETLNRLFLSVPSEKADGECDSDRSDRLRILACIASHYFLIGVSLFLKKSDPLANERVVETF